MSSFVIVGVQRTGTTLVRTTLDEHPAICCLGEICMASSLWLSKQGGGKGRLGVHRARSYRQYVANSWSRRFRHVFGRDKLVQEYLDELYSSGVATAIGFKFMYNQQSNFPAIVPYIFQHNVKVIHVVRENVFNTYLSRVMMQARGSAHSMEKASNNIRVQVPVDNLRACLDDIQAENEGWKQTFSGSDAYLQVKYESFVADRYAELRRMTSFLDVEHVGGLDSGLKRLRTRNLTDSIENFDQVVTTLTGTPHEWCIDCK